MWPFPKKTVKKRNYEAASRSNRLSSWNTYGTDANASNQSLSVIRNRSRDLVRNNPHAARIVQAISSHVVGFGITGAIKGNKKLDDVWQQWAESRQCDADGRHDFYGLQRLVMRCVVESGECLIRLRYRRPEDGLIVPLQLQVLEPDYLDSNKSGPLPNGGQIINGIEYDPIGRIVAYWLYKNHPGAAVGTMTFTSSRIDADSVIHVFRLDRPGQSRGIPWLSPIMVKLRELDIYQDAVLKRQQLANMFAGYVYDDVPGDAIDEIAEELPELEPGTVYALKNGRRIEFSEPPNVTPNEFVRETLRDIAAGIGITYESLTQDLSQVNFSSARMGANEMLRNVDQWQWQMLIPLLCEKVGQAFINTALQSGMSANRVRFEWTPPAKTLVDPTREIPAIIKSVRAGLMSYQEALRAQGMNPDKVMKEIAESNAMLDKFKIILDSDPRVDQNLTPQQVANNDTTNT
jgi:lambda family phage portal protein